LADNANLGRYDSPEEYAFAWTRRQAKPFWIGYNDVAQEGTWVWVGSEEEPSQWANWCANQPDNSRMDIQNYLIY